MSNKADIETIFLGVTCPAGDVLKADIEDGWIDVQRFEGDLANEAFSHVTFNASLQTCAVHMSGQMVPYVGYERDIWAAIIKRLGYIFQDNVRWVGGS